MYTQGYKENINIMPRKMKHINIIKYVYWNYNIRKEKKNNSMELLEWIKCEFENTT